MMGDHAVEKIKLRTAGILGAVHFIHHFIHNGIFFFQVIFRIGFSGTASGHEDKSGKGYGNKFT